MTALCFIAGGSALNDWYVAICLMGLWLEIGVDDVGGLYLAAEAEGVS